MRKDKYNTPTMMKKALIYFLAKFHILWIWQGQYFATDDEMEIPYLGMEFYYKWGHRFDYSETVKEITQVCTYYQNDMTETSPSKLMIQESGKNSLLLELLKNQMIQNEPHKIEEEINQVIQLSLSSMISEALKGSSSERSVNKSMNDAQEPY